MQSSLFQNQPLQYRCIWGKTIQNIFVKFFRISHINNKPTCETPIHSGQQTPFRWISCQSEYQAV